MRCQHCGADNPSGALTCARCTHLLSSPVAPRATAASHSSERDEVSGLDSTRSMRGGTDQEPTIQLQRPTMLIDRPEQAGVATQKRKPARNPIERAGALPQKKTKPLFEPSDSTLKTEPGRPVPTLPSASPRSTAPDLLAGPTIRATASSLLAPQVPIQGGDLDDLTVPDGRFPLPSRNVAPSQPMLPEDAPRPQPSGDDVHISVQFEKTFVGAAQATPAGIQLKDATLPATQIRRAAPAPVELPGDIQQPAPAGDEARDPAELRELLDNVSAAVTAEIDMPALMSQFEDGTDLTVREDTDTTTEITPPEEVAPTLDEFPSAGETLYDTDITSESAQNVHRIIALAPLWKRILAGTFDLALAAALTSVYLFVAISNLPEGAGPARGAGFDLVVDAALVYSEATVPAAYVLLAVFAVYETIFVALFGATPGLFLVGSRVIGVRRRRTGLLRALVRSVVSVLGGVLLGLGWSWLLLSRRRRTMHDLIAGTVVGRFTDELSEVADRADYPDVMDNDDTISNALLTS